MDMWDKFWQVYVKNHDAPLKYVILNISDSANYFFFNKLSWDNNYKLPPA